MRHPTAAPGRSEVPSPYEADGEVMRLAWVRSFSQSVPCRLTADPFANDRNTTRLWVGKEINDQRRQGENGWARERILHSNIRFILSASLIRIEESAL